MSCFIVSQAHINALASFAERQEVYFQTGNLTMQAKYHAGVLGQILLDENTRSVNTRYNETEKSEEFIYNPSTARKLKPLEVVKACQCLEYQSCESEDWHKTDAHAILQELKDQAIRLHIEELKHLVPGTRPSFGDMNLWEVAA